MRARSGSITFTAGAALARGIRVVLSSGKLAAAGASAVELGTVESATLADGDVVAVCPRNVDGTVYMVAAEALSVGDSVYADADGKVGATNTNPLIGVALEAAGADGDLIEVLRQ